MIILIKSIPLPRFVAKDHLIWHFTKSGRYSFKSGYNMLKDVSGLQSLKVDGNWQHIWNLKVPPKVRHFMWQVGRNCLPTRDNLLGHGIECWTEINLLDKVNDYASHVESFTDRFFQMLNGLADAETSKFTMMLWALWKHRNDILWRQKDKGVNSIISHAFGLLCDWLKAKEVLEVDKHVLSNEQKCDLWHCPPQQMSNVMWILPSLRRKITLL
ncbi:hypothetical protein DITRI_Ditri08aG0069500 [Diplodiscus trichospermus]